MIRKFTPDDQSAVNELQAEFMQEFFAEFADDPRQTEWNADIADIAGYYLQYGGKFWVVEKEQTIVGVGGFRCVTPTVAEIKRIRIKATHRSRGFGKALVRKIEAYCRDHRFEKILVDTDERLATAKRMYESLGYTVYRTETVVESGNEYVNYYFEKALENDRS